ncbi:hypothetical protein [Nereida sp. MMG025]|uniref:hypothetical protein n=1 Tax=Nereida sp. MMG025 TaxID=2909981 RepID=UPI001F41B9B5|nr:hypothetical protein [Nereida sp. MMG025]MCF6444440.1 hypothetical protein [Nereida sp. MMG025]
MSEIQVTKTRLQSGVWEGLLDVADGLPEVVVTFLEKPIEGVEIGQTDIAGRFTLRVPLPIEMLSDGVHTALISATATGETLEVITSMAGDDLKDDIRGEMSLLRSELDMLKRAFRRHCVETT